MMAADPYLAGQQVLWCALMAVGFEFLLIAMRIKDDWTFLLLGAHIILLSLISGIDIWLLIDPLIREKSHGKPFLDFWQIIYQVLACIYISATVWMTRILTNRPSRTAAAAQSVLAAIFALALLADLILPAEIFMDWRDKEWHTTWIYDWVFAPYLLGVFTCVVFYLVKAVPKAPAPVKRTLKGLSIAYFNLLLCGLLDIIVLSHGGADSGPSYAVFGILGMGMMGTFLFSDKLITLYSGQRLSVLKINEINGAMQADHPLRLIGISATKVSEEIRHQVSVLKSHSGKLMESGYSGHHAGVARIDNARKSLERYSTAILDFSGSARLGPLSFSSSARMVQAALKLVPAEIRGRIRLSGQGGERILADFVKLPRALSEVLKNAGESGARNIEVRLSEGMGMASIAIADDGGGCPRENMGMITQPFFTTRKEFGAWGLGASIADGIIRSHGGMLLFYPRPGPDSRIDGLLVNIILPMEGREPVGAGEGAGQCLLISERTDLIAEVLSICGNLGVRLSVVGPYARGRKVLATLHPDRLVILDQVDEGAWDGWNSGHGRVYTCGPDRLLQARAGSPGLDDPVPLCEETFLRILPA